MPEDRRHIAVMFTDIVGYTALMGSDEDKAFDMLKRNHTIHATLIKKHNGKLIKEVGDGTLASFPLASDAVRCAMEIQAEARSQKIPLKIGIHQGEMVLVGADVLGDAVNVASRLQESAEEGCISISGKVYSDVKNKAGIEAEFVEEKSFKNVDEPVKVYKVCCEKQEEVPSASNEEQPPEKNKLPYYIIVGLVVVIAAILIWQFLPTKETSPPLVEGIDKSIAVLPFINDSPDQENEYFCNGMMEEILTQLQKIADLKVKSRTDVEQYRDETETTSVIGAELDVAFILEGSVRKAGDNLRITAQLINVKTGDHLWANTYDGKYNDEIFEFQSDVAQRVASSLNAAITAEEEQRIERTPTTDIAAYDFYIKGRNEIWKTWRTEDDKYLETAHDFFDKALEIDPNFLYAISGKSGAFLREGKYDSALIYADKVIALDPGFNRGYASKGACYSARGKYVLAIENYLRAISLPPKDGTWGRYHLKLVSLYLAKNDVIMGLRYAEKAVETEKVGADGYFAIGDCFLHIGDYKRMEEYNRKGLELVTGCDQITNYWWALLVQSKFEEGLNFLDSVCVETSCDIICGRPKFYFYLVLNDFKQAELHLNNYMEVGGLPGIVDSILVADMYNGLGREEEALTILNNSRITWERQLAKRKTQSVYLCLSSIHALMDEKERALMYLSDWAEIGFEDGWEDFIGVFPAYENLHDDPEFKAIIKRAQDEKAAIRAQVQEMIESGEIDL